MQFLPLRFFHFRLLQEKSNDKIHENSRETLLWIFFAHLTANKNFYRKSAVFCFESSINVQNFKMNRFQEKSGHIIQGIFYKGMVCMWYNKKID